MLLGMSSCAAYGKCGKGSYGDTEKTYDIKGFSGIVSEYHSDRNFRNNRWNVADVTVHVEKSDRYGVSATVSDAAYSDAVRLEKSGSNLLIILECIRPLNSRDRAPEVNVYVKTPELDYVDLSGVVKMYVEGSFDSDRLDVHLQGATELNGLDSRNSYSVLIMNGASSATDICISSGRKCAMDISGAVNISGLEVTTDELDINFSGAAEVGNARIHAENIEAVLSGAAKLGGCMSFSKGYMELSGAAAVDASGDRSESLHADLSGAASMELSSEVCGSSLELECRGASSARMKDAPFRNVTVAVYGASSAHVNATESLRTDVSKTASLDYYGKPASVYHGSSNIREH